ncbi:MAG: ABC transporter permease [Rhodomicrobium sp.]|jgi:cell division transport system permease protein
MSSIETTLPVPFKARPQPAIKFARANAPIVPPGSVTGSSLTLVIAIMSFLAALTAGGVYVIFNAANVWTNKISAEITVQIQQRAGDSGDEKSTEITRFISDQNGVKRVTPFTREQSLKLVEPWIGKSEVLKSFAIPRLIAVEIDRDNPPDISTLKKVLEAKYPGALLDDHGHWRHEIRRLTRLLELAGVGMLFLMATATAAVIIAAATSSLASNREIVSVLNFVGAEEKFIARQFEAHFLKVGIKAGIVGAGLAAIVFFCLPYLTEGVSSSVTSQAEIRRLVGAGTLDPYGYIVLLIVVIAVAAICKMTSRYGVRRILNQQNA